MVTTIVGLGRGLAKYPLDSILDIGGFVTNKGKTPSYKCYPTLALGKGQKAKCFTVSSFCLKYCDKNSAPCPTMTFGFLDVKQPSDYHFFFFCPE